MTDDTTGKIRVKMCGTFKKELEEILRTAELGAITASYYPMFCGHPQKVRLKMQQDIPADLDEEPTLLILGGCYQGTTKPIITDDRSRVLRIANCLYILAGESVIDKLIGEKAFVVTPSWLNEWQETLNDWGLDQKTAQSFFHESASKLVLLDTGLDPDAMKKLRGFADYIDLPFEAKQIGLDYFKLFLSNEIRDMQKANAEKEISSARKQIDQKEADSFMLIDLLQELAEKTSEEDVIKGLADIFSMLFAQSHFCFIPHSEKGSQEKILIGECRNEQFTEELTRWNEHSKASADLNGDATGFFIRVYRQNTVYGVLGVTDFMFPQYTKRYLTKARIIAKLCGMLFENIRLLKKVESLANIDSLTQLYNRRYFYEAGQTEIDRGDRYNHAVSIIMFDIDFFKSVNDTYGHASGDQALKTVSDCVRNQLRNTDIAGRLGGEEFAIILPETAPRNAFLFAERLRHLVENTDIPVDGDTIRVTISLGLASRIPGPDAQKTLLDTLIRRCDEAMYTAKKTGRNRTVEWQTR